MRRPTAGWLGHGILLCRGKRRAGNREEALLSPNDLDCAWNVFDLSANTINGCNWLQKPGPPSVVRGVGR